MKATTFIGLLVFSIILVSCSMTAPSNMKKKTKKQTITKTETTKEEVMEEKSEGFSDLNEKREKIDIKTLAEAIGYFETGSDYSKIGNETDNGNKAYGKYQIMDFNISSWSLDALGREIDTTEFMTNKKLQDKIAIAKMKEYYKTYGRAEDVVSMWFSGKPYTEEVENLKDVNNTDVKTYVTGIISIYKRMKNGTFEPK